MMRLGDLEAVVALSVAAGSAGVADDQHGPALATTSGVGRHGGFIGLWPRP
jgi:hypothetical protein